MRSTHFASDEAALVKTVAVVTTLSSLFLSSEVSSGVSERRFASTQCAQTNCHSLIGCWTHLDTQTLFPDMSKSAHNCPSQRREELQKNTRKHKLKRASNKTSGRGPRTTITAGETVHRPNTQQNERDNGNRHKGVAHKNVWSSKRLMRRIEK